MDTFTIAYFGSLALAIVGPVVICEVLAYKERKAKEDKEG